MRDQSVSPLSYPYAIISIPDFEADTGNIYKDRFRIAAQQAALELLHPVKIASRSALTYYGIEDCHDSLENSDPYCLLSEERVDIVLSVSYNNASLGVTLFMRWMCSIWGTFWPERLSESLDLGADSSLRLQDPEKYWIEVKDVIGKAIKAENVDRVVFLGSEAKQERLQRIVGEVLKEKGHEPHLCHRRNNYLCS